MRKSFSLLASLALTTLLVAGCAGPEQKMGRGISNLTEITRGNELERELEQSSMFEGSDAGMATGFVRGMDKTLARTGVGLYEVVTAPLPPYHPVWTSYLTPKPEYPDSYRPRYWAEPFNATDHYYGFSGGDVAPWFMGSRFRIFDN